MTIPTGLYDSLQAIGQREDVSDLIHNISPTETPFLSLIGTTTAGNTLHEWQTDTLAAPAANVNDEGQDATDVEVTPTTRLGDYTQISIKLFNVTGTLEVTEKYGRDSELAYQAAKAARELKKDVDFAMCGLNQPSKTQDSTGRQSGALMTWIKSNISTSGSGGGYSGGVTTVRVDGTGRTLTQAMLDAVIQTAWNAGAKPSVMLCGPTQKTVISTMDGVGNVGSASTHRTDRAARTIFATVDLYVSNFGELRVVPSRHIYPLAASPTIDSIVFIVDPEYAKVGYLRPWQQFDLAKVGDSIKREMLVEWTLEMCNEAAHGAVYDLN